MLYYDVGLIIGYKQFSIKSETSDFRSLAMSTWITFNCFRYKLTLAKNIVLIIEHKTVLPV